MVDFVLVQPERFERLLDGYMLLVSEVEQGYSMCIYEYTNDLSCRSAIQEMLDNGYMANATSLERLQDLDQRLRRLLIPTLRSIHGRNPESYFWFSGIPCNAAVVIEDARSLGILSSPVT